MATLMDTPGMIIATALAVLAIMSRCKVNEAPHDWLLQTCHPAILRLCGIMTFAAVTMAALSFHCRSFYAGCGHLCRAGMTAYATIWLRRHKTKLDVNEYRRTCFPILFLIVCVTVWYPVWSEDAIFRHRSFIVHAVFYRVGIFFHSCEFRSGIIELILFTVSELLAVRCSALHFGEAALLPRLMCTHIALSAVGALWNYMWCVLFRTLYDTIQQVEVEKDALASILSMVSDASFWLAADGDTFLDADHKLEAILGARLGGKRLSQRMPPEEHARLRELIGGLPEEVPRAPVYLLSTTVFGPGTCLQAVDLFIVDRRSACQAGDTGFVLKREHTQAPSQRRGFLIGLRLAQGSEVGVPPIRTTTAGPSKIPQFPALDAGCLPETETGGTAPTTLALPLGSDKGADAASVRSKCSSQLRPIRELPAAELAAPDDGEGELCVADDDSASQQEDFPRPGFHRAPSMASSSCGSWYVQVRNGFLTLNKRRTERRSSSAPPRLEGDAVPAGGEAPPAELCEDEIWTESSTIVSSAITEGTESDLQIRVACEAPPDGAFRSTDSSAYLSDVMRVRASGWQSLGSAAHNEGVCKICFFHGKHRKSSCVNGVLCPRCHEEHGLIHSRRRMRQHNKASYMFEEGQ